MKVFLKILITQLFAMFVGAIAHVPNEYFIFLNLLIFIYIEVIEINSKMKD
jgi:hypothetical protein